MNAQIIICPVCGLACTGTALYRYTVAEAAEHFCSPTRNLDRNQRLQTAIRNLWQQETCDIYRCQHCGFGFGHPHIGGDEAFYSILHEQKAYPAWRWDYDFAVQEALALAGGGMILDIGAGVGSFLRCLPANWQRWAVELSHSNRRDLENEKIQVIPDLSTAALMHKEAFQVVTLFQVLEHISEFKSALKNCHQLLAPTGKIVITVPDGDAMIGRKNSPAVPICHPTTLTNGPPAASSSPWKAAVLTS